MHCIGTVKQFISRGFTPEGLSTLEEYAKQFIGGKLLFTRFTSDEQSDCAAGGTLHVIASILSGAETQADRLTAPEGSFKREQQRAEAHECCNIRIEQAYKGLRKFLRDNG